MAGAPPLDANTPADPRDVALFGRLKATQPSPAALAPAAPEDHSILGIAQDRLQGVPREDGTLPPPQPETAPETAPAPPRVDAMSPADPSDLELFGRLRQSAEPPLVRTLPALPAPIPAGQPQAPVQGIQAGVSPSGSPMQMDVTGRAIDPVTGQPMVKGQPHAGVTPDQINQDIAQGFVKNVQEDPLAIAAGQTIHTLEPIFRVLSLFANPYHAAIQKGWEGASEESVKPGATPFLSATRGFIRGVTSPAALAAAGRAITSPDINLETPQALPFIRDQPILGFQPGTWQHELAAGLFGFGVNLLGDEATGPLQGYVLSKSLRGLGKVAEARGLYDHPIPLPGGAKSLNDLKGIAADNRSLAHHFGAAEGAQGPIREEAINAVKAAQQSDQKLRKILPGKAVDAIDQLTYHWIEAGSPGAKFASRAEVEQEAVKMGATPQIKDAILNAIRTRGGSYSQSWQKIGHKLEEIGYLKKGTVDAMGGTYAARMYQATSHNPGDIEEWLREANEIGGVAPGAINNAEALLGRAGAPRGGAARTAKGRKLDTFAAREAHGAATAATPVFGKSVTQQSQIAAKGQALQDIAKDPTLARSGEGVEIVPPGFKRLTDPRYGPLNGMIVPDHVKAGVDSYLVKEPIDQGFQKFVAGMARFYKQQAMFLSFPSLLHKVKYDSVLAEGRAADAGLRFTKLDVGRGAWDLAAYLKDNSKTTSAIEALKRNTRAFVPGLHDLGDAGKSLMNSLGSKPPNMAMAVWNKLRSAVPEGIGKIEQTYKVALTEKLAAKYGYDEAARIAQQTIGDWRMTDPSIHFLERYGGIPFLTARAKAFPKMMGTAIRHPQILQRAGHLRLGPSMAAAIGPEAQTREEMADPGAIPIPGLKDKEGRQRFITRDPLRVEPLTDILGLGGGVMGVTGLAGTAAANVDLSRSYRSGQAESIVDPGAVPPLDDLRARLEYIGQHLGPSFVRSGQRIQRAAEGKTKYGGPYQEPESLVDSILGVTTGVQMGTPKTATETKLDAVKNAAQAGRAFQYAAGYLGELMSGKTQPRGFLGVRQIDSVGKAKVELKNATRQLKQIAFGQQYKGDQQIQELKKQVEWIFTLRKMAEQAAMQETTRNAQLQGR